jgi:hypothetical protein
MAITSADIAEAAALAAFLADRAEALGRRVGLPVTTALTTDDNTLAGTVTLDFSRVRDPSITLPGALARLAAELVALAAGVDCTISASTAGATLTLGGSVVVATPAPDPEGPPPVPTDLTATAVSDTAIRLAWVTPNDNTIDISTERSLDGVTWAGLGLVNSTVLAVLDTSLTPETEYHYRVRAGNGAGYSAYTDPVSATTQATRPRRAYGPCASALPSRPRRRTTPTSSTPARR